MPCQMVPLTTWKSAGAGLLCHWSPACKIDGQGDVESARSSSFRIQRHLSLSHCSSSRSERQREAVWPGGNDERFSHRPRRHIPQPKPRTVDYKSAAPPAGPKRGSLPPLPYLFEAPRNMSAAVAPQSHVCDCGAACTCTASGKACSCSSARAAAPAAQTHVCDCGSACTCTASGKACTCSTNRAAAAAAAKAHVCDCGSECTCTASGKVCTCSGSAASASSAACNCGDQCTCDASGGCKCGKKAVTQGCACGTCDCAGECTC